MDYGRVNIIYEQIEGIKHPYFTNIILLLFSGLQTYVSDHITYLGWSSLIEDCCHFNYLFNKTMITNLSQQLWKLLTVREKIRIMFFPIIHDYPEYTDDFTNLEGSPIMNVCLTIFKEVMIDITTISNILLKIAQIHARPVELLQKDKILQITYPSNITVFGLEFLIDNNQIGLEGSFSLDRPSSTDERLAELFDEINNHVGFDNILKLKIDKFIRSELDIYGPRITYLAIRFIM